MALNRRDEAILRFLAEKDVVLPPTPLYVNLLRDGATFSQRTVRRRLQHLADQGLVEKVDQARGYYGVTDRGRAYLDDPDVPPGGAE